MAKKRFPYLPLERPSSTITPPPPEKIPRMSHYSSIIVNPCAVCTPGQKEKSITVMTAESDAQVVFVSVAKLDEDRICHVCSDKLFRIPSETETLLHRSIWPVTTKKPNA